MCDIDSITGYTIYNIQFSVFLNRVQLIQTIYKF
jgi:hypothetical protein